MIEVTFVQKVKNRLNKLLAICFTKCLYTFYFRYTARQKIWDTQEISIKQFIPRSMAKCTLHGRVQSCFTITRWACKNLEKAWRTLFGLLYFTKNSIQRGRHYGLGWHFFRGSHRVGSVRTRDNNGGPIHQGLFRKPCRAVYPIQRAGVHANAR